MCPRLCVRLKEEFSDSCLKYALRPAAADDMSASALNGEHAIFGGQITARAAARHAALGDARCIAPYVILIFQKVNLLWRRGGCKPRQFLVMIILTVAPIIHYGLRCDKNSQLFEVF